MKKHLKKIGAGIVAAGLILLPAAVYAAGVQVGVGGNVNLGNNVNVDFCIGNAPCANTPGNTVGGVLGTIYGIVNALITICVGLAVLLLLIGILRYVASGDNDENRAKGRNLMIYGIIGIAVMVSIWGLVNVLVNTFKLDNNTVPNPPTLPNP